MSVDWGDGDYGRTASTLVPAAEALLDAADVRAGARVLDVACGTGNLALAAAARGATATGVDGSARLVARARDRAAEAGVDASFLVGDVDALPVPDGAFEHALSVFGVIFAADPGRAAAEMVRAARPGGVVGLTAWVAEGPIAEAGRILRAAIPAPGAPSGPPPRWDDAGWITALLEGAGVEAIAVRHESLAFSAASPEAWFAEEEAHHPAWRWGARELGADAWAWVRERSVEALRAGNEDPSGFRTISRYLVVSGRRRGGR